ncbi:MAG TPA: Gfo/Idh/MocA family oxidoreductase [Solirubrobacteraceae bacterium]|jgi:predicted dehydrogenase|nr:Gfo/Idh/MocA family oxidoreductase [Solirubrobacteraceae bacterium]
MNAAPLRLGLVGCGRLAEVGYVPALARTPGVDVVAVCDVTKSRRTLLASKLGASAHPQVAELLAAGPLDGLVVCSTPEHHEEALTQAAAARITALVEKPPAPDAAGALRLARLSPAPFCGFNRRFDQGMQLAARIPDGGDLELQLVLHYRRASWKPLQRGEDALLDLGPHLVDLALMLTAALPVAVRAHAARDRAGLALATSRGTVRIECATNLPYRELVEVRDSAGRRIARAARGGRVRGVAGRVVPRAHPLVRSLSAQLQAYERALRGGDPGLLATAVEGAAVMCVLDAARRSDAIGGETTAVEGDRSRQIA